VTWCAAIIVLPFLDARGVENTVRRGPEVGLPCR
jgi:hypothetical protein